MKKKKKEEKEKKKMKSDEVVVSPLKDDNDPALSDPVVPIMTDKINNNNNNNIVETTSAAATSSSRDGGIGSEPHQVVVMPVVGKNGSTMAPSTSSLLSPPSRTGVVDRAGRSLTPGRRSAFQQPRRSKSPKVSRPRDIVQEVYDRMGVQYVRGANNTIELDDSKSVVSIQSGSGKNPPRASITKSPGRNRSSVASVSTFGPDDEYDTITNLNSTKDEKDHNDDTRSYISSGAKSSTSRVSTGRWVPSSSTTTQSSFSCRNKYTEARDESAFYQSRSKYEKTSRRSMSKNIEKRDDAGEGEGTDVGSSIKSKISKFGGGKGAVNVANLQKIKSRRPKDYRKSDSAVAASFLAAVSSPKDGPKQQQQHSHQQEKHDKDGQSIGKASLYSGVTAMTKGRTIPIEIHPSTDYHGIDTDDHSIAASSVSGEDFAGASTKTPTGGVVSVIRSFSKYTTNNDGHSVVSAMSRRSSTSNAVKSVNKKVSASAYKSSTEQMIERIVDERIALKLKSMAESMTAEIQRVRDETKAQVDELERKLMAMK